MAKHNDARAVKNLTSVALIGAAVGTAAYLFSSKDRRDKAKQALEEFKDKGEVTYHRLQKDAEKATKDGRRKLVGLLDKARDLLEEEPIRARA